MEKPLITVGIVSDIVCPWCYIGKRRLQRAMEFESDRFDFELEYLPFELDPHVPEEGVDNHQYHIKKFGGESKFEEITGHLKKIAAREGLEFNFEKQKIYPNTRNAHRIILFAREAGKEDDVLEALYRAYFTEGVNLSDKQNLVDIAASAGLDRERVGLLIEGNTGKTQIEMAEKELHDLGINSVPLYIINDKITISGAQSVDTFTRAFEEVTPVTRDVQRYAHQ